jgi:hypothetical protein
MDSGTETGGSLLESEQDAEDALQQVFLQACRTLHTCGPTEAAFSTRIYRFTVNHCLNRRQVLVSPSRGGLPKSVGRWERML